MFEPIGTGGLGHLEPDAVDGLNIVGRRRVHPSAGRINHHQLVVTVHNREYDLVGFLGGESRMNVKQRLLSVVPAAK